MNHNQQLLKAINKLLQPIERRNKLLITRGIVKLVNSELKMQALQVKALGQVLDNVEHFEPYGFTSHPHENAETILASLGGHRGHTVAVCVADRNFRLKNTVQGEVAIYTDEGDVIHFKRNNIIDINSAATINVTAPNVNINASTKVTLTTPDCEITGNLNVGGDIVSAGQVSDGVGSMADMRIVYNGHTHVGDSGGSTGTPSVPM